MLASVTEMFPNVTETGAVNGCLYLEQQLFRDVIISQFFLSIKGFFSFWWGVGGLELQLIANSLISPMPAIHFLPLSGNRLPVVLFPIKVFQRLAPAAATRSVSEVWVHPAVSLQRSKLLSLPVRETQTHCGRCSISRVLFTSRPQSRVGMQIRQILHVPFTRE